ncbi:MAG: hypothetical protein ABIK75_05620 [candidate division WOR-3 bacterium]
MRTIFTYALKDIVVTEPNTEALIVIPASSFDILNLTVKSVNNFLLYLNYYTENLELIRSVSIGPGNLIHSQIIGPGKEMLAYFIVIQVNVAQSYDIILESVTTIPL